MNDDAGFRQPQMDRGGAPKSAPDERVAAFMCAWGLLQSAARIRSKVTEKDGHAPLPDLYWACVAEATAFADLARADMPTGVQASALRLQYEAARETAWERFRDALGLDADEVQR